MKKEHEDKQEQRIRFVAKHYRKERLDADQAWKAFAEKKGIKKKVSLSYYWRAVAAVILVCVMISTWYFMSEEKEEWLTVTTGTGQIKNVFLPDSSMVSMAENSIIKYDLIAFKKGSRDVEMKGKIFFQVKKKKDSPFSVSTESTVVTVLGTSFQVHEMNDRTELFVSTGKVSFSTKEGGDNLLLTAGMSAVYEERNNKITKSSEDNTNTISWKTKELHFNDTPLEDVIRDLSDCYNVQVVNRLSQSDKHLTASFNDLTLEDAILIINQTLDVHLVVEAAN